MKHEPQIRTWPLFNASKTDYAILTTSRYFSPQRAMLSLNSWVSDLPNAHFGTCSFFFFWHVKHIKEVCDSQPF